MKRSGQCVVILPYYCQAEIDRYLLTARWLRENRSNLDDVTFVLAASPKAEVSQTLQQEFAKLAPTRSFQCPTQVFGYPAGPTAMFWDAMDYVAEHFSGAGFSLWLESDMAFVKPDWRLRLQSEWESSSPQPLLMGCFVPRVYKFRWLRQRKLILEQHINGGACYALDFAKRMPAEAREGVFDMSVYQYGQNVGRILTTQQIAFSSVSRARRDVLDPNKAILHGFMEDKDAFIRRCVAPVTAQEIRNQFWSPWQDRWEQVQRQLRVLFVRRGHRAMMENMLLTKNRMEAKLP